MKQSMFVVVGILFFAAIFFGILYSKRSTMEDSKIYTLKKGDKVVVNGLSVEHRNVQSVQMADHESLQHNVTLYIQPEKGEGKEFSTIVVQSSNLSASTNTPIQAFGHTVTILKVNGFISQDIEIKVF